MTDTCERGKRETRGLCRAGDIPVVGSSLPSWGLGGVQHPTPAYPRCQNPGRTQHRSSFPFFEPPAARLHSGGLPVVFGQLLKFKNFHVQTAFATSANYTQVFQSSAQGGLSESFPSTFPPMQSFQPPYRFTCRT